MGIRAGTLKYVISVVTPSTEPDEWGENIESVEIVRFRPRCSVRELTFEEKTNSGIETQKTAYAFKFRKRDGVSLTDKVKFKNKTFDVRYFSPMPAQSTMIELVAELVE